MVGRSRRVLPTFYQRALSARGSETLRHHEVNPIDRSNHRVRPRAHSTGFEGQPQGLNSMCDGNDILHDDLQVPSKRRARRGGTVLAMTTTSPKPETFCARRIWSNTKNTHLLSLLQSVSSSMEHTASRSRPWLLVVPTVANVYDKDATLQSCSIL